MEYRLRVEGVGKRFGSTDVLKSAALWAKAGQITTLMGRNGSGKTTLMRIAAGHLRADQGTVWFEGTALERPKLHQLARAGLMYVPQDELVVSRYRVIDHFGAFAAVFPDFEIEEAVEKTRIAELLKQRVATLSGGERMRVSLALAMARRPRVLLVDEPLVGLAPRDQEMMAGLLRNLAEAGSAIVTSGHDTRILLEMSDAILWSVSGTTHYLGTPKEATQHTQFCREYLGPLYD